MLNSVNLIRIIALFLLYLSLDFQQLQEAFSVKSAMKDVSTFLRSCHKKEPPSRSLERTAPWYWLYKYQIEMVLQTSSSTGSSVLVKNRLSQNIAAIRHILYIYLSPLYFRSIFLYVDTRLSAFLQKKFLFNHQWRNAAAQKIKVPATFAHGSHSEP